MYGERCYGITCDDYVSCIETVAYQGITGANVDSMGLQSIVYWPNIRYEQRYDDKGYMVKCLF